MRNKTPVNDWLTKEFFKTFWGELKTDLMQSINWAFCTKIFKCFIKASCNQVHWEERPW